MFSWKRVSASNWNLLQLVEVKQFLGKQALITSLRDQTGVAAFLNMNRLPAGQGQQQHYSYNFIDFHEYISEFHCWQMIAYFTLQM